MCQWQVAYIDIFLVEREITRYLEYVSYSTYKILIAEHDSFGIFLSPTCI